MSKINFNKSAQTVIMSYVFYLVLSLFILISIFYYTDFIDIEIKLLQEEADVSKQNQNLLIQHFNVVSKNSSVEMSNRDQNYTLLSSTYNQWSSFENDKVAYFFKHQLPFCENYSLEVQRIESINVNESNNCIEYNQLE